MKPVDFMCIGAAKAGTTWLCHHLRKHPNIYICAEKEIHYFNPYLPENPNKKNPNFEKPLSWYNEFFKQAPPNSLAADFSTSYLKYVQTAQSLYQYNPQLKIIVLLRHPIDRAMSQYRFLIQRKIIKDQTPTKAFKQYPHILKNSLYAQQLMHYFEYFPKNQIKILWFQNIKTQPQLLLDEICRFLQIKKITAKDLNKKINPTQTKPSLLENIKKKLWANQNISHELSMAHRKELIRYFEFDTFTLEKMLNRDLSDWKL